MLTDRRKRRDTNREANNNLTRKAHTHPHSIASLPDAGVNECPFQMALPLHLRHSRVAILTRVSTQRLPISAGSIHPSTPPRQTTHKKDYFMGSSPFTASSPLNHCPKSRSKLISPSGLNTMLLSNSSNELATLFIKSDEKIASDIPGGFPREGWPPPIDADMGAPVPRIADGDGAMEGPPVPMPTGPWVFGPGPPPEF